MSATATSPTMKCATINRKELLTALDRAKSVIPTRHPKPILSAVRLESDGHMLQLAATDGDIRLLTQVAANGELPPCVVSCPELVKRVKASKDDWCSLSFDAESSRLIVNGGRVEHMLHTMDVDEFPPIPDHHDGETITLDAEESRTRLKAVGHAVAREPSRYAINGVLMESDSKGVRLIATDGRRMVIAGLDQYEAVFMGQVIIPVRVARLIEKFAANEAVPLVVAVKPRVNDKDEELPADIYVAGPHWLLHAEECDGRFPPYRDIIPESASKFVADRLKLIQTLNEISLATTECCRAVRVDLTPDVIQLSAASPEIGESTAQLPARFIGGGDSVIHTAFNPGYLLDAVKSLGGVQAVIDVSQNGCGMDGKVFGKPALLYAHTADDASTDLENPDVRCVVMPINANLAPTRENLGSNYREDAA